MKTPTAIFLGLALIATAIFFREPSISPAHAARDKANMQCFVQGCWVTKGNKVILVTASSSLNHIYKHSVTLD